MNRLAKIVGAFLVPLLAVTLLHAHFNLHMFDSDEIGAGATGGPRKSLRIGHLPVT